ncbi:MAG: type II secretion system F family protein [Candidatus Omnitrophica bacterium]|jgi:type IV pilus assembly protein PilC|nr:type II secretion system F family protein [Candidatus Omnitrophota bacterium]MDD3274582.1 type II secretion system F family protein [Candidatus Omnitrophota bacterium]MDD5077500.1 type II secretion system F family protein [Candidatus Omnitrophota bacterium]
MNFYKYSAKDKNGQTVSGQLQAFSEAEVVDILHKKEMIVFSVEQGGAVSSGARGRGKKIKLDDLVVFSRQLATMIDAGIPLVNSLGILAEQIENENLRMITGNVRHDIEAGLSFCEALAKYPAVFSDLFINMVKAGEASGMLNEILDRLATFMEKQAALNRKIISSLVYPAVIVGMAVVITAVLLIKVVPTFKGIFDSLGGELPLPTQVLIFVSDILRRYFLAAILAVAAGIYLFRNYLKTVKGRYRFDRFILRVPVFGPLLRKLAVAKFSRTFSTLVKSGVSILSALEIVSKTSGNKVVEESVLNCLKSVRNGEPIARPLAKSGVFPPMVTRMISVGEQTGQLEKMLSKIADFYDNQVDAAAGALTSLIEPLVIAFLGIVIGGIVIALFLPIFKISQLMGR